jgi:tetratricopeptide (TPR) repeat protein
VDNHFQLAEVLGHFVDRSGYTPGQLARLSGIPKPTIVNWLEGRVKRPRLLPDLLRLAAILRLTQTELSALLQSAGYPALAQVQADADQEGDDQVSSLLAVWEKTTSWPQQTPFQAMADLPTFVGREDELGAIRQALSAEKHDTIYSLQGMGGIGKTALVVRAAYLLRAHFPDGVLWAQVDTSEPMSILNTFANAYGVDVNHYTDISSRSRVVRELLANKRLLLILDNAQSSAQVKPLLPPTGTCAVVVTTRRNDLSVTRGARRFLIGPFKSEKEESLALFAKILGQEYVATRRQLLTELADLLGHLPLAIDIAASRLAYEPGWSAADFLQRVRQEQRRLAELAYEDQSVRLSFNTSYKTLTPEQQHFFAALGVFSGDDFSDEAAAFITDLPLDEAQDRLRQLYGLSLVQQGRANLSGQPARYRLHLLLRDYAREQLQDKHVVTRLVAYFVSYAQQNRRAYAALDMEMENIQAALQQAAAKGMERQLVQGLNALYYFLEARGLYELAGQQLAQAEATAATLNDPATLLVVKHNSGRLAQRQGKYIEAETHYQEALALAREIDDRPNLSHLLRALGVLAARQGDYVLADAYYKEGLALARELGHGGIISNFLRGLGVQAYMRGDFARAEVFYEEGLALIQVEDEAIAGIKSSGSMLWGLGVVAHEQGDDAQAESYYQEALWLAREEGNQERIIILLRSLAGLAVDQGNYRQAENYYQEALALARQIGRRWQIGRVLSEWGEAQWRQGMNEAAAASFHELFQLARLMQSQELVANALYGLARVTAGQGNPSLARERGQASLDAFISIGHYKVYEVQQWLVELS